MRETQEKITIERGAPEPPPAPEPMDTSCYNAMAAMEPWSPDSPPVANLEGPYGDDYPIVRKDWQPPVAPTPAMTYSQAFPPVVKEGG